MLPLEQFIDKAADLGFDGVMLMAKRPHLSLLDYGPKERERLRGLLDKRGLRKTVVAGYSNFTGDLVHSDIPHTEFQIHYLTELARAARDLGAVALRVFTGYEEPITPFQRQWDILVKCLREVADRAAEYGVVIGVQNHHDLAVDPESLYDLIHQVNHQNCRAMFDAWAPALQGISIEQAAQTLGGLTIHTTVANYQRRARFRYNPALVNYERLHDRTQAVLMSEGFIDYAGFFEALIGAQFEGTVAYEMCSPLRGGATIENLDLYAANFLEYMHSHCGRL